MTRAENEPALADENTLEFRVLGQGVYVVGYGSLWRHDVPSGNLMRFDQRTGDLTGLVPLSGMTRAGLRYLTSITTGADGVWVTVA